VGRHAVDCLYLDQWDFLTPLFEGQGAWACFVRQHGPHREGVGLLLTAWLYDRPAWSTRAEAFLLASILVLAAGLAVIVAARLRGRLSASDVVLPLLLLSTAQFEHIVTVPSVSPIILPVLLVLTAAAVCLVPSPVHRVAALAPLHVLCTFTGYAVIGGAAVVLVLALHLAWAWRAAARRAAAAAVAALAVAASTYAAFFSGYRFDPALPEWRFPAAPLLDYLHFVALQYGSALGWRGASPAGSAAGTALATVVTAAALFSLWRAARAADGRDLGRWSAVAIVALSSLGFAANAAVGRMPLGLGGAFAHRYASFALLGIAAALLAGAAATRAAAGPAAGRTAAAARRVAAALALLVAVRLAPPPAWAERDAGRYTSSKRRWVATYLRTDSVAAAQSAPGVIVPVYPDPEATDLAAKLRFLRERRLNMFRGGDRPPSPRP